MSDQEDEEYRRYERRIRRSEHLFFLVAALSTIGGFIIYLIRHW